MPNVTRTDYIALDKFASYHDDVIKWKHFPRYWSFVRGVHWSPVNSPHRGQWRGALVFSLVSAWVSDWVDGREAGVFWDAVAPIMTSLLWCRWPSPHSALVGARPSNCAPKPNCERELWGAICARLVSIFVLHAKCNMAFAKYTYHNTI